MLRVHCVVFLAERENAELVAVQFLGTGEPLRPRVAVVQLRHPFRAESEIGTNRHEGSGEHRKQENDPDKQGPLDFSLGHSPFSCLYDS